MTFAAMSNQEPNQGVTVQLCIGYTMIGLGSPSVFLGFMLVRLVFLPSRYGNAMASFRPDHPAFIAGAICLIVGLALLLTGMWLVRTARNISKNRPP